MKPVAVILSGCGVFDGSEVQEVVMTLLALSRAGVTYRCFAPDREQLHVVNHLSGQVVEGETRNILVESARIVRGKVQPLDTLDVDDFDALIVPGGFGAAKNLCDFAVAGSELQVAEDVTRACRAFIEAGKPSGYICIAPIMMPKLFGEGVHGTIGTDVDTAQAFNLMGGNHQECPVDKVVIDHARKVASTPAYMLASDVGEAADGISKLVLAVIAMCEPETGEIKEEDAE